MRTLCFIIGSLFFISSCSENASVKEKVTKNDSTNTITPDNSKKSIPAETVKTIGNASIKINYHAPAVRGRTIWGGLVPYDEVWVTGAHKATSLEISEDFKIGYKLVPAGKYAFFTIPGKVEWTVIINRNWDQHLADNYSETDDVARFKVKPEWKEENTERLNYAIEQVGERTAIIAIRWEKLLLPVWLEVANK